MRYNRQMRTGFTMIEMVVVGALIMTLIVLILPSLQKVRDEANALRCQARLHQLGKFMGMYTDRNQGYFPQMFYKTTGGEDPTVSEAFSVEMAAMTLEEAGVSGMPLSQLVCPADPNPGMAPVISEEGPLAIPISYSYNLGSNLWGMQYFNMMDYTTYERWPVLFDGAYGPQIAKGYLSPVDFAHETVISRHPIDKAYVLYADWHVEPLLEFRYRFTTRESDPVGGAGTSADTGPGAGGGSDDCVGGNNNGHGNNRDGVDVSNPGQGGGGPNGKHDESGDYDDENRPGNHGKGC